MERTVVVGSDGKLGVMLPPIATLKPGESWIISNNSKGEVTIRQCPTDEIAIPPATKQEASDGK